MPTPRGRTSIWSLGYAIGPFVLAISSVRPLVDNSFLWHIRAGDIQRNDGAVLTTDPFSFLTLGSPWRTQSWLAEMLYSWGVGNIGLRFGQLVAPAIGIFFFLVVAALIRSVAPTGPGTAIVSAFTTILMLPYLQPRPVIFSYLALALMLLVLRQRRARWTPPLLTWLWASLHGSFFLAFVLMATEWYRTRDRRILRAAVPSLIVVNFTAHGWGIWQILYTFSQGREALERISEWLPPDLLAMRFIPIVLMIPILVSWIGKHPMGLRTGLPLLAWLVFGLTASRSMPLFWIVFVPVAAEAMHSVVARFDTRATLPTPVAMGAAALMVALPLFVQPADLLDPQRFPIQAAEALTAERVFHDDVIGGYLIYRQWPERLVYVDDRAELYGSDLVAFADTRLGVGDWENELDRHEIEQAIVRPDDAITSLLELSPAWTESYADEDFRVFDRVR